MRSQVLVAGAGIGGLAAAIAAQRAGWEALVREQAAQLTQAGAGIQLGPNAVRRLHAWGLQDALARVASWPERLVVRNASSGARLGELDLGEARARYGAPYATLHRADLHQLLLEQALAAGVDLRTGARVTSVEPAGASVRAVVAGQPVECDLLVGADGIWSPVRRAVIDDGPPRVTGHGAWRALVPQSALPAALRSDIVTAWLGPDMHGVTYPVRGGAALNVVVVVRSHAGAMQDWDLPGSTSELLAAASPMAAPLRELVGAAGSWKRWALHDRAPMRGPQEMARGRIVLAGDAAHPMLPYLAQGAAMAIEDADELGRCLTMADAVDVDVEVAMQRYALNRWQRCARVQARSQRNGRIFHATGLVRVGRDMAMKVLGERLLDQPWLYRG